MGNKLYEENSVQAIASAIRSKLGTETTYKIGEMADAISTIVKPSGTTNVTENGYHNVAEYEQVYVHVEGGITPTGTINLSANGDYDVTNYAEAHVAVPQPVGKKTVTENGTDIDISSYATLDVAVPQYGKPRVPQTGTWQYKRTYPCGFLIIGKDDDVADSAMFVRMVNGYGFPVTLNSTQQFQNNSINSDADTEYSQYPEGSYSLFPNGGTINQLNKLVIKENRGEIALHGVSAEKIWDSTRLTGDTLDAYYATYTAGGGTKTEEEFKAAIVEKYADMDIAQGAPIVTQKRLLMQEAVDNWLYTIGTWGGNLTFVIDDINCGESGPVNSTTQPLSRSQNWMGDGQLNNQILTKGANPYWIYRDSGALTSSNIEATCELAYNNRVCIDAFHHFYLDGTAEKWNNFKSTMDIIKSYYEQGKIFVVTRKQYYDLGEFVEHPITSISFETKNFAYGVGHVFTENDFNISANLDNGASVSCENDKILYLDDIDTTTEGIYTARIEYRGHFGQCSVTISNNIPSNFLLENYSATGTHMTRNANLDEAIINPAIHFENGKHYRYQFHVRMETEVSYTYHYVEFEASSVGSYVGWRTSTTCSIDSVNGITEGDISFDIEVNRDQDIDILCRTKQTFNTSIGNWTITNGYIYEIPAPEVEGGE